MTRLYYNDSEHVVKYKDLGFGDMFSYGGRICLKVPPKRGFNSVNIMSRYETDFYVKVPARTQVIRISRVDVYQDPHAWEQYTELAEAKK